MQARHKAKPMRLRPMRLRSRISACLPRLRVCRADLFVSTALMSVVFLNVGLMVSEGAVRAQTAGSQRTGKPLSQSSRDQTTAELTEAANFLKAGKLEEAEALVRKVVS